VGVGGLGERVQAGDSSAFAELYGECADRLFGFCLVLLRDRDEAADAAQDAFVLAVQRASQLRNADRLHAWLFAIARHVCYRRLEQRQRVVPRNLPPDALVLDDDPVDGIAAEEAAALVWAAAAGLSERDRAALYLHTSEGLEGPELAAALGLVHANPYSLLSRARAQLGRAVCVLLVARANRRKCSSLGALLDGWDGALTPLLRKRVGRHIDECASCQAAKLTTARWAAFAAAPFVKPQRANAMSLHRVREIAAYRPAPTEQWRADGFPPLEDEPRRRGRWLVAAAAVLVLLAAVLGLEAMSGAPKSTAKPAPVARQRPSAAARRRPPARAALPVPRVGAAVTKSSRPTGPPASGPVAAPTTSVQVQSLTETVPTTPRTPPPITAPRVTAPPATVPRTTTTLPVTTTRPTGATTTTLPGT
jgi:RNA polymerase sigma factor (sigma-70 family)